MQDFRCSNAAGVRDQQKTSSRKTRKQRRRRKEKKESKKWKEKQKKERERKGTKGKSSKTGIRKRNTKSQTNMFVIEEMDF